MNFILIFEDFKIPLVDKMMKLIGLLYALTIPVLIK